MKKQKRTLKELYALAKGKPASCCQPEPSSNDKGSDASTDKCCSMKKENSCC